ncbi:unnamed protein product [Schistocephalus solidus]|uniref:Lipoprotein n=1 Tax=Schistocephalus solidus TaxID=70667 RepID=A0A183TL76_SCHSO|nr:unnamed protein product [Schistocephalus solidus]
MLIRGAFDLRAVLLSLVAAMRLASCISTPFLMDPGHSVLGKVLPGQRLHLPQHGVDAEDSSTLTDIPGRDPMLQSQLQFSAEAAEMEVIQLPGLTRVDGPGLRSKTECRQDDGRCSGEYRVIPHGGLQPAEGLNGFGDPLSHLVIDYHVA